MAISLARGERIKLQTIDVFADGVAIKAPGAECFRLCRSLLDGTLPFRYASSTPRPHDILKWRFSVTGKHCTTANCSGPNEMTGTRIGKGRSTT